MSGRHPFSGVKVLEVSRVLASPFCASQLGFLGADIIKVEDPGAGDAMRTRHGNDNTMAAKGMSPGFLSQNANKKSITLNLRTPAGQKIFRELAAGTDIVIENLRTGTMDRYGLGYGDLASINPRLIYCSLTAYGQSGAKKRHPAYDPVVQAASGMMSINGTPETAPVKIGPPVVDYGTGMAAAFAIATALFQRERTGVGQHIDVSMLDMAFVMMGSLVTDVLTAGAKPQARGNSYVSHPTNASFPTRDGLIFIAAMEEHQLQHLWQGLERPDIANDPRFRTAALRRENFSALRDEVAAAFLHKRADEWEILLNELGVPAMRVRSVPEAVNDPMIRDRGLFVTFDDVPGLGRAVTMPAVPFKLSECDAVQDSPPPLLGAHTDEVLASLGYGGAEVEALRARGVV